MTDGDGTTTITLPDGKTVELHDYLLLTRSVQGEDYPRVYRLTGKPFAELLAAVKALPARSYDSVNKLWRVNNAGLAALKEAGLSVTILPPIRVMRAASQALHPTLEDGTWTVRVVLTVQARHDTTQGGWWDIGRVERKVTLSADEVAAAHRAEMERLSIPYQEHPLGNHWRTAERLAVESLKPYADELTAVAEEARGKNGYTKAAYRAAFTALEARLAADGLEVER